MTKKKIVYDWQIVLRGRCLNISGKVEIIVYMYIRVICIYYKYSLCALTQIDASLHTILFIVFTTRRRVAAKDICCAILYILIIIRLHQDKFVSARVHDTMSSNDQLKRLYGKISIIQIPSLRTMHLFFICIYVYFDS